MTIGQLKVIAHEYLEEDISIKDLAARHGMSKTTLIRYFNGEQLIILPLELQLLIDKKKKQNWIEGKSTSGNLGHKTLTTEQIQRIAKIAIENNLTLRELAKEVNVNYSTIYELFTIENLGIDLYKQILNLYNENKVNKRR